MIYFTADLHLGHTNIIKYNNRPFKDVDEMDNVLIKNWNSVITAEDTVYVLGDLTMRASNNEVENYLRRLSGKRIILLRGNHDYYMNSYNNSDLPSNTMFVSQYQELKNNNRKFVLFHYPIMDWNGKNHGSIHLHGHIHSWGSAYNIANKRDGNLRYDVGVDANNFMPVSMDSIVKFFAGVKVKADHHGGK